MKKVMIALAGVAIGALAQADQSTGIDRFICAAAQVQMCIENDSCYTASTWELNVPDFVVIDLDKKMASSALARRQTSRSNVRVHSRLILAAPMLAALLTSCEVAAQELTPRAYWPLPKDANAFVLSYQRSSGYIVTDPSLPLTGVDSVIDSPQVS